MSKKRTWLFAGVAGLSAAGVIAASVAADRPHGQRGEFGSGGPRDAMRSLALLHAADADDDRSVTLAELEALEADLFAWLDRTADGRLDSADRSPVFQRLEAKRAAARAEAGDEASASERGPRHGPGRHGRRGFGREMDADNDGAVTREEFASGHYALFARFDADGDEVVTPDELDASLEERRERRKWWRAP